MSIYKIHRYIYHNSYSYKIIKLGGQQSQNKNRNQFSVRNLTRINQKNQGPPPYFFPLYFYMYVSRPNVSLEHGYDCLEPYPIQVILHYTILLLLGKT